MKSEAVNRSDNVALQTFCTAEDIDVSLPSLASLTGTSCMTAATIARGPSRIKMRRRSRFEGKRSVRNCMCVIYE